MLEEYALADPNGSADLFVCTGGNQPGDVVKDARGIVYVLTSTGVAQGKEIHLPMRLAMGRHALRVSKFLFLPGFPPANLPDPPSMTDMPVDHSPRK
ncbi:hypothetical protein GGR56DRAFT_485228 [Xylariaceae sp. FL0804]|nr:hypothetical protein GGR56DRAFT_485228 [Xylariaceae sp. FL0804]